MTTKTARIAVLAGCGYILLYLGLNFAAFSHLVAVPIMLALMAFGTAASGHRAGPRVAMLTGATTGAMTLLMVVKGHATGLQLILTVACLAAAVAALLGGWTLAKAQKQIPAEGEPG